MTDESDQTLLTVGDIAQWRKRLADVEREMAALFGEKNELIELIDMAARLHQRAQKFAASPDAETVKRLFADNPVVRDSPRSFISEDMTFPDAVYNIVANRPSGITTAQIKKELESSPLSDRLLESDKGFYHATSRLRDQSREQHLVVYRGYLFTPHNLNLFRERVRSGLEPDKSEKFGSRRGSPMSKRIEEIISENPGIAAKGVVTMLINEGFSKNENSAFNTLSRMKKANELIGGGKNGRELFLGPNARIDSKGVDRNENGAAEAAPDAGRGATLPFENQDA